MMPTILLTGATGFLGSHLLKAFLINGYKVVVLKRSNSNIWRIESHIKEVATYNVDIESIELPFKEHSIDIVIHSACDYGRNKKSISSLVDSNIVFGLKVLDASLKFNTSTFINTDTFLDKNLNFYSLSKRHFLEWLHINSNNIHVINLKIEHMYGEKDDTQKLVPWVLSQLKENTEEINLTKGDQERDFIYIDDVVSAYIIIIKNLSKLKNFNQFEVGTGNLVTVKRFIKKIKENFELINGDTNTKLNFGTIPYRKDEKMTINLDNSMLISMGWMPKVDIDKGLKKVINDYH
jgi:CDP-paratose synthetase